MNALLASAIGLLAACGVWLVLRTRAFPVVLGLMLLGYAANLLVLAMGRLGAAAPPLLVTDRPYPEHADPVPQALVLTAIVIGFGMSAFAAVLAVRARATLGTDHVDGADAPAGAAADAPAGPTEDLGDDVDGAGDDEGYEAAAEARP